MGTLIQRQHCASAEPWFEVQVPSRSEPDKYYQVKVPYSEDPVEELICECDGFLYRGRCAHQDIAFATLCRWTEIDGPEEQTNRQEAERACPRCQGKTIRTTEWA